MNLSPVLKQQFLDNDGVPLNGGSVYSYAAGTTTPQATYSNATGTANTNPVVLDSAGRADIWLDPSLSYKIVLKDSSGNTIFTEDNVTTSSIGITGWNANTVYSQGDIVTDSSGQGLLYVSLISNNQNNALTSVSSWRVFAGNIRTVSTNTTLAVTDDLVRSNSTSGSLTHTLPPCATTPIGKEITVKDVGTGGNTTNLIGSGSDLIDGNNTYATPAPAEGVLRVKNNGTSWDVLSLTDGSVTTNKLAAQAVTAAKIANNTITASQIANNTITSTQIATTTLNSGTYTATVSNKSNISTNTFQGAQWLRVGNVVTVSGRIDVATSASSGWSCSLGLPVASTLSGGSNLAGSIRSLGNGGSVNSGTVSGSSGVANLTVNVLSSANTSNDGYMFHFTYLID